MGMGVRRNMETHTDGPFSARCDPTADVACTRPIREAGERLALFGDLVGDRRSTASTGSASHPAAQRFAVAVDRPDLEAKATAWTTRRQKGRLRPGAWGSRSPPSADTITLDIVAPDGAGEVLDGIGGLELRTAQGSRHRAT